MNKNELMNPLVVLTIVLLAVLYVNHGLPEAGSAQGGWSVPQENTGVTIEYPIARDGDWHIELIGSATPQSGGDWWHDSLTAVH